MRNLGTLAVRCLFALGCFAFAGPRALAETESCPVALVDVRPVFDSDLHLEAEVLAAWYQSHPIALSAQEYRVLQTILLEPRETAAYGKIFAHVWGTRLPRDPKESLAVAIHRIRTKFKAVDPDFDRLEMQLGHGVFWRRKHHRKISVGRISASKSLDEGFVDEVRIHLSPLQAQLLRKLLLHQRITARTLGVSSAGALQTVASRLNIKFRQHLHSDLFKRSVANSTYVLNSEVATASRSTSAPFE